MSNYEFTYDGPFGFWKKMVGNSKFMEWIDASLRGSGQVVYMDNPLTGLLNFVAFAWACLGAGGGTPEVLIGTIIGTFVSTAAAYWLQGDPAKIRAGLYGFNGCLVGAALPTFLGSTPLMWIMLVFASGVSTILFMTIANMFSAWKVPAFTFPFNLTAWIFVLAAYRFTSINIGGLPHAALTEWGGHSMNVIANSGFGVVDFITATLNGVGQIFFIDNPISGAIFLIALLFESAWCAGLCLAGAAVGVAIALLMGADHTAILNGMYGYSPALVAPAIGCIFMKTNAKTLVYALIATITCTFVQSACYSLFTTIGVPTFTFPFVITGWFFLIAWRNFESDAKS